MDQLVTPDSKVEALLQIIAVLLDRLGGEAVINYKEYVMYEGIPVVQRSLTNGYIVLRLGDEDEVSGAVDDRPRPE